MSKIYKLTIENISENISLVRLNSSFIASRINFNVEEIEDIKVSVSEAMNYQLNLSKTTEVEFILSDNKIEINVINENIRDKEIVDNSSDEFAKMILESLMDEVLFEENKIYLSKSLKVN
ncbi:anti-sigma regulatory factor [Miniphocaeibacter massiliensis]|uniref:anti-sigma regulatory factor n=1 Tax=Miniphocaeibacter massiliensis TaxID=2041841 RepID=UPI000C1C0336|nr:anti-sigma regulatory factor [Miniphocaeibacter massiliensis]